MDRQGEQRPTPPQPGGHGLSPGHVAAAQDGARGWARQAAALSAQGLGWATPRALLAGLCAGALAPLAVVAPGPAVLLAGMSVVGSVGANLLSDVIGASLIAARARTRDGAQAAAQPPGGPPGAAGDTAFAADLAGRVEQVERELAARLEEILQAGGARAETLAETLAVVLSELQATQVVIGEAIAHGDALLLEEMVAGFAELGRQTAVLAPMLGRLDAAAGRLQRSLYRQDAEHRFDRTQRQRQEALLVAMREQLSEKLSALERRLPALPGPSSDTGAGDPVWTDGCPYQGLAPFGPAQAGVFYGRGQATARLAAMVTAHLGGEGLIVVTGASGAGKSSLLHAGLLPALAATPPDDPGGGASWPQVTFTPGARPLQELAVQLAVRCGADPDAVLAELRDDPARARTRARQILAAEAIRRYQHGATGAGPRRLVMVVDQFEELFTLGPGDQAEEAEAFVTALEAVATGTGPVGTGARDAGPRGTGHPCNGRSGEEPAAVVVLAVRGDFVDRCAAHPALARALEERVFVLSPMSRQELQRAITGPAAAAGLSVEDGLAEQVVRELAGHPQVPGAGPGAGVVGALPLLSMAMARTWHNREGGRLTRQGYDRSGGVASAVQDAAEDTYTAFSPRQREIAKRVIVALTLTAADGQVTRRRAHWGELAALCEPEPPEPARQVVEAFAAARLMVIGPPAPAGAPDTTIADAAGEALPDAPATLSALTAAGTVELAHDVLVTVWPRLRSWMAEDQADRVLHGEILQDAAEWDDAGRDTSFLYRGIRLEAARGAVARWHADPGRYLGLTGSADAFLDAGVRAATRTRRRWQAVFSMLAGLLVVAIITAVVAVRFGQDAERQRTLAEGQRADLLSRQTAVYSQSLPGDPVTSARLAAAAWAISRTDDARASMADLLSRSARAVLTGHDGAVRSVAFSRDGSRLASAGQDGTVRLWDVATHDQVGGPLVGHDGPVRSVAFSRDSSRLASGGEDGTVRLWNVATHEQAGASLTGHGDLVASVVFSPDGSRLASAGYDGTVRLWDVATHDQVGGPLTGHDGPVWSLAFNADGSRLASGGDDSTVRIWDTAARKQSGATLRTGSRGAVWSVAFSRDGSRLASGKAGGAIRIWDAVTREQSGAPLPGHDSSVWSLVFGADGSRLVSARDDGTIRIWDLATRKQSGGPLPGHDGDVWSVASSADGSRLASAGTDGTIRIWDVVTHQQSGRPLTGYDGMVASLAFSADGSRLASAGQDGRIRIWDAATHEQVGVPLTGHDGEVNLNSVAFGADGSRLASGGTDGTIRIWDLTTRKQAGVSLTGHDGAVNSVAFGADGSRLASGGADGTIRIWDPATRKQIGASLTGHDGAVNSVVFGRDGSRLASAGQDGTVRIWDLTTRKQAGASLTGHDGEVWSVVFGRDGSRLASAGQDGTVRIWDLAAHKQAGASLTGHDGAANSVAFSPDGSRLASAGDDGTVRIWDATTHKQTGASLNGHDVEVWSVAFSPDGSRVASGTYRTVRLWDVGLPPDLPRAVCGVAHRGFTPQEWQRYFPGELYRRSCPPAR
ncbi:nSTAND1 domain-containing NTPase [Streptosporangium sp. G11]|uniref:nSTAND1 domain-containing NTPase n=1 Tax=Streptosporangium sp. G11 TaxID=3436926 RepID=UPI003EBE7DAD